MIPTLQLGQTGRAQMGAAVNVVAPLLDGYTANLIRARSITNRLLTSYTGPLFRVIGPLSAEQDIGYGADNLVDLAALASFLAGGPGLIKTVYDQSGLGFNYNAGPNKAFITTGGGAWLGYVDLIGTGSSSEYMATANLPASTYTALTSVVKFSLDSIAGGAIIGEIGNDSTNILGGFFEVGTNQFLVGVTGSGSSSIYNTYTSSDIAMKTRAWRSDRAAGTNATKNDFWIAGAKQTLASTTVVGSPSTAAFASVPQTMGARATGPNFSAGVNFVQDAMWSGAAADADVTLYSAALA